MRTRTRKLAALGALTLLSVSMACSDEGQDITGTGTDRIYTQVERLGNPLVSEVTLAKRNHGFHNSGRPSTDVVNHSAELKAFVTNVAGRDASVANTLATVLLTRRDG